MRNQKQTQMLIYSTNLISPNYYILNYLNTTNERFLKTTSDEDLNFDEISEIRTTYFTNPVCLPVITNYHKLTQACALW